MAFDIIAVAGTHSSQPHGRPSDYALQDGDFLTLDFGAQYEGYMSDMTRTVAIGHVTDEMKQVYNVVLEAQLKAIEAMGPGVSCREVDAVAREVMKPYGYDPYFTHSLGHSFGLQIHEKPGCSTKSDETLVPGTVMTVEPGIYLSGRFGVRIEDDIYITEDGKINLTQSPKELLIL
ncbi:MAG: M24 family metallopeptidase [Clostridia bacterium]|nr:M24 family metallopeptidase [Clostridia bacterium]